MVFLRMFYTILLVAFGKLTETPFSSISRQVEAFLVCVSLNLYCFVTLSYDITDLYRQ